MKIASKLARHCALILIVSGAVCAANGAQAGPCCKAITKTGGDIVKGAGDAGKDAGNAGKDVGKDAGNVADKGVDQTKAAADKLAKQGAAISSSDMKALMNQAGNAYAATTGAVNGGYKAAVAKLQSVMTALLDGIWRAAGKRFVAKNAKQLLDMRHRAMALDADGQAALNRVKRAIAGKQLDEQARLDMQTLLQKIVYGGNKVPASVQHSSFGIQLCVSAGAGYGGAESCFMMIMQTYLEDGKYKVGLAQSFGVAASPAPSDIGAAATYGLFWGPGGISDNSGPSVGLALGAVLDEGAEVGVSWGVPTSMPNPDSAIPGLAISIGAGVKGEAALSAGYTEVVAKL